MVRNLLKSVGFGWMVRAIALVQLVLLGTANLVLRVPQPPKQRRRLIDVASLTDWPYMCFVFGCFVVFLGMYTPFYFVQSFAIKFGIASEGVTWYLVAAMNIGSIPGRIIPTLLVQRTGPLNLMIGTSVALASCGLGFLGASTIAEVYVVATIYGFFSGSFFALQPTIFVRLTANMAVLGTRFGIAFTILSVALLFGTPISGALQGVGGYDASWIWAGATAFAGGMVIWGSRVLKAGGKAWVRV